MDILTPQDFNQIPYNVPDAQIESGDSLIDNEQFKNFIVVQVEGVLIKILGVPLYEAFMAGLDSLPDNWSAVKSDYALNDTVLYVSHVYKSLVSAPVAGVKPNASLEWELVPDTTWLELYNGLPFYTSSFPISSTCSRKRIWPGLKGLLIPYVYAEWLKYTYDDHTKVGIVRRTAENATIIDPTKRIVRGRNDFSTRMYNLTTGLVAYLSYANSLGYYTSVYGMSDFAAYLKHNTEFIGTVNEFNI